MIAFGHDVEQDLLRAVTGKPTDAMLGDWLAGAESLHANKLLALKELPDYLDKLAQAYESKEYQKNFPWIDHVAEVKDNATQQALNRKMLAAIATKQFEHLWLAVPEIIDWSRIGGFRYQATKGGEEDLPLPDIHIRSFLTTVRASTTLSVDYLKRRRVHAFDRDDQNPVGDWSVYQCLYHETELEPGSTYLLSNGKWYKIDSDFVSQVNRSIASLPETSPALPTCNGLNEGAYNEKVSNDDPAHYALLDKKLIQYGGGQSKIEVCDLLAKNKRLIHVKHFAGSSVLSHLFAQGVTSANLLVTDGEFRKRATALLPKSHAAVFKANERPAFGAFEVAYVVISRSEKDIQEALPFFSRVNLRNAVRQLEGFGFKVTLSKVKSS